MFTGIVEEVGLIENTKSIPGGISFKVCAFKVLEDIAINDSICVDGVCLTVTKFEKEGFWVDAVGATLQKTTFAEIKNGSEVNLERSVKLNDRLGGHLVQGHVNGIGTITEIHKLGENYLVRIAIPEDLRKYLIKEGSIAINGISLTIADVNENIVSISIIPHTWKNTTIKHKKISDNVNVEIDILAKYVEKLLTKDKSDQKKSITENWLKELGY